MGTCVLLTDVVKNHRGRSFCVAVSYTPTSGREVTPLRLRGCRLDACAVGSLHTNLVSAQYADSFVNSVLVYTRDFSMLKEKVFIFLFCFLV